MIPEERLSTQTVYSKMLVVDKQPAPTVSRELGGVGIGNPNQGLMVQVWTLSVRQLGTTSTVLLESANTSATPIFSDTEITEASLSFDQNARPTVAYVSAGVAKLYWYDSVNQRYSIDNIEDLIGVPGTIISPRCTLDDHRQLSLATSDIIVVFLQGGSLYFAAQRDRYQIPYLLYQDLDQIIENPTVQYVGMNRKLRLQIAINKNLA